MALTFFRDVQYVVNNIDITLSYKVLNDHIDCVFPDDYLPGTYFCLHDPDGNIPGELLLNEVVRQSCVYATQGLSIWADYMVDFYSYCTSRFTETCSNDVTDNINGF